MDKLIGRGLVGVCKRGEFDLRQGPSSARYAQELLTRASKAPTRDGYVVSPFYLEPPYISVSYCHRSASLSSSYGLSFR